MIDDHNLDAMLSAPLREVPDNGFALGIAHAIEIRQTWRERLAWGGATLATAAFVPFVPVSEIGGTLMRLGPAVGNSAALSLALALLVLTISFEQRYREWQADAL